MGDQYGFIPLGVSSPINNNNRQSFGGGKYSGGQRFNNRNRNHYRQNNQQRFSDNRSFNRSSNNDISQYFHPSMLEDPWQNLTKNLNASYASDISCSYQKGENLSTDQTENEDQPQQNSPEDLTTPHSSIIENDNL